MAPAERPENSHPKRPKGLWRFMVISAVLFSIAVVLLMLFLQTGLEEAGFHIIFATFLGLFFTSLITIGLMGLIFYSDRAGFNGEITLTDQDKDTQ